MNNQDSRDGHAPSEGLGHRGIERLAWLPIPLLLAVIIVARVAGLNEIYEAPTLRLVLSFIFYTLVSLSTLILIGRSFLVSGTFRLLLIECGLVLWSLAGTVGDAVFHGDANINITIFNSGILLSGMCLLAGAILSCAARALNNRPFWLGSGLCVCPGCNVVSHMGDTHAPAASLFRPRPGGHTGSLLGSNFGHLNVHVICRPDISQPTSRPVPCLPFGLLSLYCYLR